MAEILISERIAWQIERHFGRYGEIQVPGAAVKTGEEDDGVEEDLDRDVDAVEGDRGDRVLLTGYSSLRVLVSWVLGLGAHAPPGRRWPAALSDPGDTHDRLSNVHGLVWLVISGANGYVLVRRG